jgi:hypothetical protein
MEILDANAAIVKECIIELVQGYKKSYDYYIHHENYESALIAHKKLTRLNKLSTMIVI